MRTTEDIEAAYTYHPPTEAQQKRYASINEYTRDLAEWFMNLCPDSPERTLALRKLQEARMWANASIAINERENKNG